MKKKIEGALIKIEFLSRYKTISFNNQRECVEKDKIDKKDIIETFRKVGYVNVKYFSKEKYFEVDKISIAENLSVGLNFYTRFDEIDFILNIDYYQELIPFNGPFGVICQKLGNENFVKRPCFCSKEDFKRIISDCTLLYEDFKAQEIIDAGYKRVLVEVAPDGSLIYKELDASANIIETFTP